MNFQVITFAKIVLLITLSIGVLLTDKAYAQSESSVTPTPETVSAPSVPQGLPPAPEILPKDFFENLQAARFSPEAGAPSWSGSLFFSEYEFSTLKTAKAMGRLGAIAGSVGIPGSQGGAPGGGNGAILAQQPIEAPAFYLESIVFYKPNDWAIWINGTRITKNKPMPSVNVKQVTRKFVFLEWDTDKLDIINPSWRNTGKIDPEGNYRFGDNIIYEPFNQRVSFRLKPNQSMVSRRLEIVEGKVASETITPDAQQGAIESEIDKILSGVAGDAPPPAVPPSPLPPSENQGGSEGATESTEGLASPKTVEEGKAVEAEPDEAAATKSEDETYNRLLKEFMDSAKETEGNKAILDEIRKQEGLDAGN
jgi:hypothetical protein